MANPTREQLHILLDEALDLSVPPDIEANIEIGVNNMETSGGDKWSLLLCHMLLRSVYLYRERQTEKKG